MASLGRGRVRAKGSPIDNLGARADQTFSFHLVQRGIQGTRTDLVAMASQLRRHPRPVDLTMSSVMEDIQPHRPSEKLLHGADFSQYRVSISRYDIISAPAVLESGYPIMSADREKNQPPNTAGLLRTSCRPTPVACRAREHRTCRSALRPGGRPSSFWRGIRHSAFGIRHSAFGIRHSVLGRRREIGDSAHADIRRRYQSLWSLATARAPKRAVRR